VAAMKPQLMGCRVLTNARALNNRGWGSVFSQKRYYSIEGEQDVQFDFKAESLASRGYLRTQKPYMPPSNVDSQVLDACEHIMNTKELRHTIEDGTTKFHLLKTLASMFNHQVPNSLLHNINTVGSLLTFYKTPIDTRIPLDMMQNIDLPKNLHVEYQYTRFNPETDTMFGGVSAYTKDSCLVTGLKTKKKYNGHIAKTSWP
ncbi:unnamed protein product, partial [Meganyctiphanes norvegica]